MSASSPLAAGLRLDREEIRRRARTDGSPLGNLQLLPRGQVAPVLRRALEKVYIPTEHSLDVLQALLGILVAYADAEFPTTAAVLRQLHSLDIPCVQRGAMCMAALAGLGKTATLRAFGRVLSVDRRVELGQSVGSVSARGFIHLTATEAASAAGILRELERTLGGSGESGSKGALIRSIRKKLVLQGVCLLAFDESQMITGSAGANTRVTQIIYLLASLGPPLVYGANFSLCHKLLRRPQEDTRRLFSDHIVMRPECPKSKDWEAVVEGFLRVLGETSSLNAKRDAPRIHALCYGINDYAIRLLCLATERAVNAKRKVQVDDLEWVAMESPRFHVERSIVRTLRSQDLTGQCIEKSLWCPLGTQDSEDLKSTAQQQLQSDLVDQMLRAPKTHAPRLASARKKEPANDQVISLSSKRVAQLEDGLRQFAESMSSLAPRD